MADLKPPAGGSAPDAGRADRVDAAFAGARGAVPDLRPDFLARLVADADTHLPQPLATAPAPSRGWLSEALSALGGWPAAAGLASAALVGVWIGAVQGEMPTAWATGMTTTATASYDLSDLMPGLVMPAEEG